MNVDLAWTQEILDRLNAGTLDVPPADVADFPSVDGSQILDRRTPGAFVCQEDVARALFAEYLPGKPVQDWVMPAPLGRVTVTPAGLEALGLALAPYTALGLLNGGMATSYTDQKKNRAFAPELFDAFEPTFDRLARRAEGQPKGLTPAFVQGDLSEGPSYLELKLRHLALINLACRQRGLRGPGMQLFQMTSESTDAAMRASWSRLEASPVLSDLLDLFPVPLADSPTAVQSLVGALTSSRDGLPRRLFTVQRQGKDELYALPAGHGQNFRVLEGVYRRLKDQGYRFAYLGNIDNLGFLTSLSSLAVLALSGGDAGFDFAFKTPFDVKGGVLYRQPNGRLNCADIGVAIEASRVAEAERTGAPILFNCATGLFRLDRLTEGLDRIKTSLPIRVSDQDKDIGRYAQAEQVTWEVIGLLERPIIFGIEKNQRFLAAKLLLDCLLTSGVLLQGPEHDQAKWTDLVAMSRTLHAGLERLLEGPLAHRRVGLRWEPLPRAEVEGLLAASPRSLAV